jgi:hypothetical protein
MTDLRDSPQRWWLMLLLIIGMIFCYAQRSALSIAEIPLPARPISVTGRGRFCPPCLT